MKILLAIIFLSVTAQAITNYPIQIGIGGDTCFLNDKKQKVCAGFSPRTEEMVIEMIPDTESMMSVGSYKRSGTYQKIGFEVSVRILHYEQDFHDDFLNLKVVTWALTNPTEKFTVESEIFASEPKLLNRSNLVGHAIGTEDDFANIVLGIRSTEK